MLLVWRHVVYETDHHIWYCAVNRLSTLFSDKENKIIQAIYFLSLTKIFAMQFGYVNKSNEFFTGKE